MEQEEQKMSYNTRGAIIDRIAHTTRQHTRWLRYDEEACAWFNGSDFVCQMDYWNVDSEGNGEIMGFASQYEVAI